LPDERVSKRGECGWVTDTRSHGGGRAPVPGKRGKTSVELGAVSNAGMSGGVVSVGKTSERGELNPLRLSVSVCLHAGRRCILGIEKEEVTKVELQVRDLLAPLSYGGCPRPRAERACAAIHPG
jgi:hypothetical protein